MKKQRISEIIGNINSKHIEEASSYAGEEKRNRPLNWKKWTLVAACFVVVAALTFGIIKFTLLSEYVTLDNGETIRFASSNVMCTSDIMCSDIRNLTEEEIKRVFGDLNISGWGIFGMDENKSIIGFEGYFNDIKLIVSVPGKNINDVILSGNEYTACVNKIPVKAGFSYSEMYVFYFADFKLEGYSIHLNNGGLKSEKEQIKTEFATALYEIISLERIDLTGIMP